MTPIRHLLAPCLLAVFAAAAHADTALNAAIVRFNVEGRHYLYAAEKIKPGDDVYLQTPGKDDVPPCCAKRSWKTALLVASDPVAIDFETADKLYRYRLDARGVVKDAAPFVGIAAFGKHISAATAGNGAVTATGAGRAVDLTLCTSPEGAHLVGQAGGQPVAHLYLYLGVVIEHPTCPADIAQ